MMGEYVTYRDNSGHYGDFEHGRSSQIAYESDHWENCEFWISLEKMRKGIGGGERERERGVTVLWDACWDWENHPWFRRIQVVC